MILIDIGNTATAVARWEGTSGGRRPDPRTMTVERLGDLATPRGDGDDAPWLRALTGCVGESETVAVVSVVPAATLRLLEAVPSCVTVDHRADLGFPVALPDPASVGPDRLANAAAAAAAGWRDALVVDAGTATTFDLLRDGAFAGGLIAPGMGFAARSLGEHAARLEPVDLRPVALEPGRTTEEAMVAGAYHVGVQGVLGVLRLLRSSAGDPPVVMTGGLASLLAEAADDGGDLVVDPDWTLKGAAAVAAGAAGRDRT